MCLRCFATKWCGITRSQVPVTSFHTLSHLIEDSSASIRSLTRSLFSGVSQHLGRGRGNTGITGLGLPTHLPVGRLTSILGRFLMLRPVLRSLPLCVLLWCFAIFYNLLFLQYSSADIPSLSAISMCIGSYRVRLLAPQTIPIRRLT